MAGSLATVGYVKQQMKSLLGVSSVVTDQKEEDSFINVEWLANLVRTVHPVIHTGIDFSYHTFDLSTSFYKTGKQLVTDELAIKVFNYLRQFKMRCACACNCDYTCNCCVQGNCEGNCGNESWGTDCNCDCAGNCSSNCDAKNHNTGTYNKECTQTDTAWNCNCATCAGRVDVNCRNDNCHCNCCQACECGGPAPDICSGNCNCCFITAAVCKSFNKPDNCYELAVFRRFRDEWLKNQFDGKILIHEYYEIAPAIVKNIDLSSDRNKIYFSIWQKWLQPCLQLIEEERFDECKSIYTDMVETLKQDYL